MQPDKIRHGLKTHEVKSRGVGRQASTQDRRATLEERRRKLVDQKGRGIALTRPAALAHPSKCGYAPVRCRLASERRASGGAASPCAISPRSVLLDCGDLSGFAL